MISENIYLQFYLFLVLKIHLSPRYECKNIYHSRCYMFSYNFRNNILRVIMLDTKFCILYLFHNLTMQS